jgi:membrane-bound lytic murein transglycosylase B
MGTMSPLLMPSTSYASNIEAQQTENSFEEWLNDMRNEAISSGISQQTVDAALSNIQPINRVIELDRKQPEGKWSFEKYRQKIVHPIRINKGQEMYIKHKALLEEIGQRYNVAPQYIVALWGIETNYGKTTGGFDIIPALATLAWEGRRAEFFKKELIHALKIIDQGHIDLDKFTGSWAGALGQNQFMPSSFHHYAVDGDGDGKKDIWNNLSDVFASTANYLAQHGWADGQRWGREVSLPSQFDKDLLVIQSQSKNKSVRAKEKTFNGKGKSLSEWQQMGITRPDGSDIPVVPGMQAWVVAPDSIGGKTYLVYNNHRVIMRWNNSLYFATSVGLIADQIAAAKNNPKLTPS